MRIVFINDSPYWNAQSEYCVSLARQLNKKGHRVLYLGRAKSKSLPYTEKYGIETVTIKCETMSGFKDLRLVKQFFRDGVEIVNAFGAWSQNLAMLANWSRAKGASTVPLVRTRLFIHPVRGDWLQRIVYQKYVNLIVVANESSRRDIIARLRLPENKVQCIYGGVDLDEFHPGISGVSLRNRLGLGTAPVVGLIARRSPVKGHRYFHEAAGIVKTKFPETRFLTVGVDDTIYLEELIEMARKSGVQNETIFQGFQEHIQEAMAALDIGIISSIGSEEHCRVGLEMMGMGKPIVGTRVGAVPEIIKDGVNGYLVEPGDSQGLARGVMALLSDTNKARAMGAAGRKIAEEKFSLEDFAERTEQAYLMLRQ